MDFPLGCQLTTKQHSLIINYESSADALGLFLTGSYNLTHFCPSVAVMRLVVVTSPSGCLACSPSLGISAFKPRLAIGCLLSQSE